MFYVCSFTVVLEFYVNLNPVKTELTGGMN